MFRALACGCAAPSSASPATHLRARRRARGRRDSPSARSSAAVLLHEHGALDAPRESASIAERRRSRRTGRARSRRRRRRASRTAPRARDRTSGACARRAARSAGAPAGCRRSPASPPSERHAGDGCAGAARRAYAGIGSSASAPNARSRSSPSSACSGPLSSGRMPASSLRCARARSSSARHRGRLATRNCAEARLAGADELALPAQRRSISARRSRRSARPAPAAAREPGRSDEQATDRGVLAAADPAAQLVQLRDPEALGVLDQHHGRVGHVDADLDHGRRDQHLGRTGDERGHRLLLLARAHLPVQQRDADSRAARPARKRSSSTVAALAPARRLRRGRPSGSPAAVGLARQRADDVGLASRAQLFAQRARRPCSPAARRRRCACAIGRRPRGSSRSALTSRSP